MDASNESIPGSVNRHALLSLALGALTVLSFCFGAAPIPLTGFVCFPISILLGIMALIYGVIALNALRKNNESGHHLAWTGVVIGALSLLGVICALAGLALVFAFAPNLLQHVPFLNRFP